MSRMRMKQRVFAYFAFFAASTFGLGALLVWWLGPNSVAPMVVFIWAVGVMVGQYAVLTCPHCGNVAVLRPDGFASPFVGDRCRYCGKEY